MELSSPVKKAGRFQVVEVSEKICPSDSLSPTSSRQLDEFFLFLEESPLESSTDPPSTSSRFEIKDLAEDPPTPTAVPLERSQSDSDASPRDSDSVRQKFLSEAKSSETLDSMTISSFPKSPSCSESSSQKTTLKAGRFEILDVNSSSEELPTLQELHDSFGSRPRTTDALKSPVLPIRELLALADKQVVLVLEEASCLRAEVEKLRVENSMLRNQLEMLSGGPKTPKGPLKKGT
jgi:hypothetical protein